MKLPNTLKFTGKDSSIVGKGKAELLRALYHKLKLQKEFNRKSKQDYYGVAPSVFIGSYNYPSVNAGILSSEEYEENDNPLLWSRKRDEFSLSRIIGLRSSMINSNFKTGGVRNPGRVSDKLKEISLSAKPLHAEVNLEKKPYFHFSFSPDSLPHGPSVALRKLSVAENPRVPRAVDKAESDTDLKASSALSGLFRKGFDEHYLTKVFSGGNLGVKTERRIVPTKWSITAVDDTVSKDLLRDSRDFQEHELSVFFGGYMGNYYLVIVIPGPWSYELFETYVGPGLENPVLFESASDYEGPYGRKVYASNTVGGYYAARLACTEHMRSSRRKGRFLVLRFISDEYWAPMGVWVVRQASRSAFQSKPLSFDSLDSALKHSRNFVLEKFNLDLNVLFKRSLLLKDVREQRTLSSY